MTLTLGCVEQGMQAEELAAHLSDVRKDVRVIARLETLDYLRKGGRVSKTVALAAGVLNIKPVIALKDGQVTILGKARGTKKANNILAEMVAKEGTDYSKPVLLGFTGVNDALLREYVESNRQLWEGKISRPDQVQMGSIIGTHAGPDAVAVAFFAHRAG